MNAEIEKEKRAVIGEWIERAKDDMESAELILKETDNYEIVVYHAHQAMEKAMKAELLKAGKTFKFVHDLDALLPETFNDEQREKLGKRISTVNVLYPLLRYPGGEKISRQIAEESVETAKEVLKELNIEN